MKKLIFFGFWLLFMVIGRIAALTAPVAVVLAAVLLATPAVAQSRTSDGLWRAAGAIPDLGRDGLARRCSCVLDAACRGMGSSSPHALDAGPACAARVAGDPKETQRQDWPFWPCAVTSLPTPAGADGRRLAAPGSSRTSRSTQRLAYRASRGAPAARASAHPAARLPS